MNTRPPKVFVSHASEDKERFVLRFAQKLREKGMEPWVDQFEMTLGDRLVEKVFQGIDDADAIIFVISKYSHAKPWVAQELDASVIRRIQTGTRLIPIIIDKCEVPLPLRATLYFEVLDLDDLETPANEVARAVFNAPPARPVGLPPAYANDDVRRIGNLDRIESFVMKMVGDSTIDGNKNIDPSDLFGLETNPLLDRETLIDTIYILEKDGYVDAFRGIGVRLPSIQATMAGLELYLRACRDEYAKEKQTIEIVLANGASTADDVVEQTSISKPIVALVLHNLDQEGLIKLNKEIGVNPRIHEVGPRLRKRAQTY